MTSLEIWELLRGYIDESTTFYLKEKTHIETVKGQPLDKIDKSLKALEIIKETPIFALYVTIYNNAYEMVADAKGFRVNNSVEELQQMFDLLKEVLL